MLSTASLSKLSLPSIPVFVKLVNGRCGEEVHKILADHDLSPVLYGVSDLEGAPKAYVMEYLDHSSWMTLSAYLALPDSSTHVAESIWFSIATVLDVLQKNRKVHGDLRDPNILVNVSLTGQLILVEDDSGIRRAHRGGQFLTGRVMRAKSIILRHGTQILLARQTWLHKEWP